MAEKKSHLVIGAGITGISAARRLADIGEQVLIIDKNNHIGGNCYDYFDSNGNYIQQYGPHIFHTSNKKVWHFLSRFTQWNDYRHKVVARVESNLLVVPFNLTSLKTAFDKDKSRYLETKLINRYGLEHSISILELKKDSDPDIKKLGQFVYEKIFLNYTVKQWDYKPDQIDPQVINRVPVMISYDNRYFRYDKYQGIPKKGFSKMFDNMLNHPCIEIMLETDLKDVLSFNSYKNIIATSPIDEFFDYKLGALQYRKIYLDTKQHNCRSYQENSVINYPNDHNYTRITEYNKFLFIENNSTVVSKEYASWSKGFVAYPVFTDKNINLKNEYLKLAEKQKKLPLFFAGRLAEFKYYNMDNACERALKLVDNEINR
ncbi:UDP-galactopyranose mutase [bacterium]|nr:UDP-galactopyranose mutase [bacterium]